MESKINSIITTTIFTLSALWYSHAQAADKPETLKGTITLGATGYGVKLENGKVIGFMGRGGNKVFATCHNGDSCEITGVVLYDSKKPLFISIQSVRKLDKTDQVTADTPPTNMQPNKTTQTPPAETTADKTDNSPPLLPDNNPSQ